MKKIPGLLLMATLLLVSCEKWTYTSKGKPIDFTFSQTAINWTSDDVIRIFCPQASKSGSGADYTIQGSTLTPKGTQLRWGDGIHSFYAVYPAGEISGNVVSANIPSAQNAGTKGVMVAAAEAIRSQDAVALQFQPLYTTLEFVVGPGDYSDIEVSAFRLESAGGGALAGDFKAALAAQSDPALTIGPSTTSQITVDINPVILDAGQTIKVTVVALPKDLTNLTAYFTVDGEEQALPLVDEAGNPIVVPACRKTTITATDFLSPTYDEGSARFKVTIEDQEVEDIEIDIIY